MIFEHDLTLFESLAVCTYKNQLTPATFQTLAAWLGCYKYILPADRTLNESALSIKPRTQYDILHLYNFTTILSASFTQSEQSNIIRYILCSQKL
jgi:hypothetical protein